MTRILIIKTNALGDVLRTTSILRGLAARYDACEITWVAAPEARDLVVHHPLVSAVETVDPSSVRDVDALAERLGAVEWDRVLSLDDDASMCRLAAAVGGSRVSGAYADETGERAYTDDTDAWFGMGLLARDGVRAADERKVANRRSHPKIFADMLGIEMGRPELPLTDALLGSAAARLRREGLGDGDRVVGLNTGAGGRWRTKELPLERTVELVDLLQARLDGGVTFVLFGGYTEAERNREIAARIRASSLAPRLIDTGTDNSLLEFAALIAQCDVLITSDSLGLHIATARDVPPVAFFAPTSAAEIELYGRGAKVVSTAPDYCSYRPDTDNSTITAARLAAATLEVLAVPG